MQSGQRVSISLHRSWLIAPGLLCAASYLALAWMNRPGSHLPLPVYYAILAAAWAGCFLAWKYVRTAEKSQVAGWIFGGALLFRAIGFFSHPVMEDDYYRYLWDGRQFAVTGNPYDSSPSEEFHNGALPDKFATILDQINYPHLRTIYAPVLQYAFVLAYGISPGDLWPLKLILLAADLGTAWLIFRMVGCSGLVLYSWCPLMIQETAFTAHPDCLGAFFAVAALAALKRSNSSLASILLGFSAGTKITGWLLVPFALKGRNWRDWANVGWIWIGLYLPFWIQQSWGDWSSLFVFAKEWEFNSGGFALVKAIFGLRAAPAIAMAITMLGLGWFWLRQPKLSLPRADLITGWFFLWAAVVQPWYLLWLLPWVALRPSRTGWIALMAVSLSYITPLQMGKHGTDLFAHPWWVRPLEYGLVALALVWDLLENRENARSQPAASAEQELFDISAGEVGTTAVPRFAEGPRGSKPEQLTDATR